MSSPASGIPYFGRAYELTITKADNSETIKISSSAWEPEALRFTFEVQQWPLTAFWFAYIKIYNCDGQIQSGPSKGKNLAQTILSQGDIVTLKAGYQQNGTDIIWTGEMFQSILTRENVVDWTLELRCINGIKSVMKNFINATQPALSTQRQQFEFIAKQAMNPAPYNPDVLDDLPNIKLPRGKTYFGIPNRYHHNLAKMNQMLSWFGPNGFDAATVKKLGPVVASYAPAFSPDSTLPQNLPNGVTMSLVGTPQQTQTGVDFAVLLDPRMKVNRPWNQVQVDLDAVRAYELQYNPNLQPNSTAGGSPLLFRPLAKQGIYIVVGVRHVGDTRGREWHSYVSGYESTSNLLQMIGVR